MRSIESLPEEERLAIEKLKSGIWQESPGISFRVTLFGSKARGDADPDSDTDLLVELDIPRISLAEKRKLQRVAGEISLESGILLCLPVVDQQTREKKAITRYSRTSGRKRPYLR